MSEPGLPGAVPPKLQAIFDKLSSEACKPLKQHLLGDTSAEWLANTLRYMEFDISASTIRTYRRSLKGV